jgi:hypothetical protein
MSSIKTVKEFSENTMFKIFKEKKAIVKKKYCG